MVAYTGPGGTAELHSHHAIQLIRSFDTPFDLTIAGETTTTRKAVIPSGVPHSFETDSKQLFLALVEPLGPRGRHIERIAPDPPRSEPETPLSDHVITALDYLALNLDGNPLLSEAAESAHISPSRLTHLFTEEVGIPFRSYVLWLRLRFVVERVTAGSNLTEAAIAAGFSDSSHLSRVFKDKFGLSPSALLRMELSDSSWPG